MVGISRKEVLDRRRVHVLPRIHVLLHHIANRPRVRGVVWDVLGNYRGDRSKEQETFYGHVSIIVAILPILKELTARVAE